MQNIEALLVCNSNMFIPVTLSEVLGHPDKKYIIISDTENIRQFIEFLSIPNVIYRHYGFNPLKDGRFGYIRAKKELLNFVLQFNIKCVIFYHAEFGAMANWLIEKLSKKLPIKYCKLYDSIPVPRAPFSLNTLKIKVSEFIYWGQKMDVLVGSYPFPSLPQSFFRKIKAETISLPVNMVLVNNILKKKFDSSGLRGKYVLLTGTVVLDGVYSEDVYTLFVNKLIESLGQDNIVSKCHPRYKNLYGKEKDLVQVPSFIPGNVLLDCFDYYIGVESTLLVEAAQRGKKAISIIDWLRPAEDVRQRFHAFFENRLQGRGNILFPKTIEELKAILKLDKDVNR